MHPRLQIQVPDALSYLKTYDDAPEKPIVDLVLATKRPYLIMDILTNINRQTVRFSKVILIPHGYTQEQLDQLESGITNADEVVVVTVPDETKLGGRYNVAVQSHSTAPLIIVMDDDDLYYPNYAKGMLGCYLHTNRPVVSKVDYMQKDIATNKINFGNRYAPLPTEYKGAGGALLYTRQLYNQVGGFNDTVDFGHESFFFNKVRRLGYRLGISDPFNFIYRRGYPDHTWQAGVQIPVNLVFENELIL